jgi:hypothetical protein
MMCQQCGHEMRLHMRFGCVDDNAEGNACGCRGSAAKMVRKRRNKDGLDDLRSMLRLDR